MTRTIPSAINLGVMSVACATVRESIAEKHHTVRMLMLDHISVTAKTKTADVIVAFKEIMAKVNDIPSKVEELTDLQARGRPILPSFPALSSTLFLPLVRWACAS